MPKYFFASITLYLQTIMPAKKFTARQIGLYYSLAQVGMEMALPVGIGAVIDFYAGSRPWGVVIGALLGLICGFVHLISILQKFNQQQNSNKEQDKQ